jgi:hypothetical protein
LGERGRGRGDAGQREECGHGRVNRATHLYLLVGRALPERARRSLREGL